MPALASYLRILSKHYGGGRNRLSQQAGIKIDDLRRIEIGEIEPTVEQLIKLIDILHGDLGDIQHLVLHQAPSEEGERVAQQRIAHHVIMQQIDQMDQRALVPIIRHALNRLDQITGSEP